MLNLCNYTWGLPSAPPLLDDDEVQVWRACLDVAPARVAALRHTLAADERARAERFRFPIDRVRSIVARGLLRSIIARYRGGEPGALAFRYNTFGKPALSDEPDGNGDGIHFNLSHADGIALYAVTRGRAVGVDIERVRTDVTNERVAEQFFSRREAAALRALDPCVQPAAFAACWTRKEAYVKARGAGLSIALDQFDVSLAPHEPAALLASREAGEALRPWAFHHLAPDPGYVGAVAVAGERCRLTCWQWRER